MVGQHGPDPHGQLGPSSRAGAQPLHRALQQRGRVVRPKPRHAVADDALIPHHQAPVRVRGQVS